MDLAGRAVLVTGAARRVGRGIALACARRGASIALHYRSSAAEARRTASEIRALGVECALLRADLGRPREAAALPRRAARALGRLDALVASASVFRRVPADRLDERAFDDHVAVNLKATYLLAIESARLMRRGGGIVVVGDVMGLRPYEDLVPYGVSKAGAIFLARALAQAYAPRLRVNCLCPGPVLPPDGIGARARRRIERATPLGIGRPEDVAAGVVYLLESDWTTGSVLVIDGGRDVANRIRPFGGA